MSESPWAAATTAAADATRQTRETIDAIRRRNEVFAKAVGGLGVTAVTAVGIVEFSDVFPVPPGKGGVALLVVAGFLGMAALVTAFAVRLNEANRVIRVSPDLEAMRREVGEDFPIVEDLYARTARLNREPSLAAYQRRGDEHAEEADGLGITDPRRADLLARSQLIAAEVRATTALAAADVLRARSVRAFDLRRIWIYGAAFLLCLLAFALGADYLESERTDKVATTKACAEAIKAMGEAGAGDAAGRQLAELLPEICDGDDAEVVAPASAAVAPTADGQRAQAIEALSEQYTACVEAAEEARGDAAACEPAARLIASLSGG